MGPRIFMYEYSSSAYPACMFDQKLAEGPMAAQFFALLLPFVVDCFPFSQDIAIFYDSRSGKFSLSEICVRPERSCSVVASYVVVDRGEVIFHPLLGLLCIVSILLLC